jgi:hypothetical protein
MRAVTKDSWSNWTLSGNSYASDVRSKASEPKPIWNGADVKYLETSEAEVHRYRRAFLVVLILMVRTSGLRPSCVNSHKLGMPDYLATMSTGPNDPNC